MSRRARSLLWCHPTARLSTTAARIEVTAMITPVKAREALDRRTAQEIERFLRTRQLALSRLIRRGLGDRQERQQHASEESDQVASASRTLDDEVQAALVDRASKELVQVDAALDLLRERRYGLCRDCADFIGLARLRSLPFAQRCRPCQERMERLDRLRTTETRRSLVAVGTTEAE
jgi:RNA polymerase-binding transcription factor DksA